MQFPCFSILACSKLTLVGLTLLGGLANAQQILVSPATLTLRTDTCVQSVAEDQISVTGISSPNVPFTIEVAAEGGGSADWLEVSPLAATTPAVVAVRANADIGSGTAVLTFKAGESIPAVRVTFEPRRPRRFTEPPNVLGVTSAAGFTESVAPGAIAALFGERLAGTHQASGYVEGSDPPRLPTEACGLEVFVNGIPAPLFFVSDLQVNFQIPYEVQPGLGSLVVSREDNRTSAPFDLPVDVSAPSAFTFGTASIADPIVVGTDGRLNHNGTVEVTAGGAIALLTTGMGPLSPPLETGTVAPREPLSWSTVNLTATFGDRPGEILYQGATPSFVGLGQINILVPDLDGISGPRIFELRADGVLIATFQF